MSGRQANDASVTRAQEKQRRLEALQSEKNWRDVLRTEAGRAVLLDIVAWCSVFRTLPLETAALQRSAGVQTAGHYVLGRIAEVEPAVLGPMLAQPYLRRAEERLQREAQAAKRRPVDDSQDDDDRSE